VSGWRELISEDDTGKVSCARVCALALLPITAYAVAAGRDAATVTALVCGGIGALAARKKTPDR
jgi:hypothetical protein